MRQLTPPRRFQWIRPSLVRSAAGLASVLSLCLIASAALGQDDQATSQPTSRPSAPPAQMDGDVEQSTSQPSSAQGSSATQAPSGLLAGPVVTADAMDAQALSTRPGQGARNARARAQSNQHWFRSVMGLNLSVNQRSAIRKLAQGFQQEVRVFTREQAPKLRELEQKIRSIRQGDGAVDPEMLQNLQALSSQRPRIEPVQYEIWKKLTSSQQSALREALRTESVLDDRGRSTDRDAG